MPATMPDTPAKPTLLYVADPMCSWCWGFSPVVSTLIDRFSDQLNLETIMGGLRPGTVEPMTAESKTTIRTHWQHVAEASGQPFDFRFFERDGFVYDTEPACRAVVAARTLKPDAAQPFLAHLHGAFYRDNLDITHDETLCDQAAAFGFNRVGFEQTLRSKATQDTVRADFNRAHALGVRGFPTLLAPIQGRWVALTTGYRRWSSLETIVGSWLART